MPDGPLRALRRACVLRRDRSGITNRPVYYRILLFLLDSPSFICYIL